MVGLVGRGINFGNVLDALGGDALRLRRGYFDEVEGAGFDTVRLPVAWAAYADEAAPYTIDRGFFDRVDRVVNEVVGRGLNAVVDVHHYHALNHEPDGHAERFLALWRQIAAHYADYPGLLHFELLNEPRAALTVERWNLLLARALAVVRESNPERVVLIGTAEMNEVGALPRLVLPEDDRIVVTVHYYAPFEFTHQGTFWTEGSSAWLGTTWGGEADRRAVEVDLAAAAAWARERRVPLFIGEFGAYEKADFSSRVRWTAWVRAEAERHGIGWAYWDFGTDFGVYVPESGTWRAPLLRALIP